MTDCVSRCQLELDLLAQRGELLMSSTRPGFCSAFRVSNLQGALQLLDELLQTPIDYQQQIHRPDARGQSEFSCSGSRDVWGVEAVSDKFRLVELNVDVSISSFVGGSAKVAHACLCLLPVRCFPVLPPELAWLFATRPVFLYPELLPCASLDPALYCSRRTAAFTAAEDW